MKYTVSFYSWSGTWTVDVEGQNEEEAISKALLIPNANRCTKVDLKSITKHGEG